MKVNLIKGLPLITALFLGIVTLVIWLEVRKASTKEYQEQFDYSVAEVITNIDYRMAAYQVIWLKLTKASYEPC